MTGVQTCALPISFYQFQNCDDSEESLSALVMQLAERVPNVEPEPDVVKMQVETFKTKTAEILANLSNSEDEDGPVDNSSVAKLFEELKIMLRDLPPRIENKLSDGSAPIRSRRMRRFDARMIPELASMITSNPRDPFGIILAVSVLRDDLPWIYEIGMATYQAIKSGTQEEARDLLMRFQRAIGVTFHGRFVPEELMISKEDYTALREIEKFLDSIITDCLEKLPASDEQGEYRRTSKGGRRTPLTKDIGA